jgi:hypothetical protein
LSFKVICLSSGAWVYPGGERGWSGIYRKTIKNRAAATMGQQIIISPLMQMGEAGFMGAKLARPARKSKPRRQPA